MKKSIVPHWRWVCSAKPPMPRFKTTGIREPDSFQLFRKPVNCDWRAINNWHQCTALTIWETVCVALERGAVDVGEQPTAGGERELPNLSTTPRMRYVYTKQALGRKPTLKFRQPKPRPVGLKRSCFGNTRIGAFFPCQLYLRDKVLKSG